MQKKLYLCARKQSNCWKKKMRTIKTHITRLLCWIVGMVCCCAVSGELKNNNLTATLQHNGQMTPFFGDSAYIQAYQAAAPGDSIILSWGVFCPVDTIKKSIRLIGEFGLGDSRTYRTEIYQGADGHFRDTHIQADDVYLEGVFMGVAELSKVRNFTTKRCFFYYLESGYRNYEVNTNTMIEQCIVEHDRAIKQSVNHTVRNTYLNSFAYMNTPDNLATVTNCFVRYFFYRHDTVPQGSTSNYYFPYMQPYAVYRNNILGLEAYARDLPEKPFDQPLDAQFPAPSQFYNNHFYRINSVSGGDAAYYIRYSFDPGCIAENNSVNLDNASALFCESVPDRSTWNPTCYGYYFNYGSETPVEPDVLGSDGTPVGVTGGELGWQAYPGIPRFTYRSISTTTGLDGILRVYSLKVKAEKALPTDNPSVAQMEYWIDDPLSAKQVIVLTDRPGPNDTVSVPITEFDFSALPSGEHVLYYRLQDTYGAYSPLMVTKFTRRNPYDYEMYLPYDATELEGEQQTANPTYSAYPTEMESKMPEPNCD